MPFQITRQSIDVLKANFKKDLQKEDIRLLAKLMNVFSIPSAKAAKEMAKDNSKQKTSSSLSDDEDSDEN